MGRTEQIAGFRLAGAPLPKGWNHKMNGIPGIDVASGWHLGSTRGFLPLKKLVNDVSSTARRMEIAAFGMHVEDSDFSFAALYSGEPGGTVCLLFNREAAEGYSNGLAALELARWSGDEEWPLRAARQAEEWSEEFAPHAVAHGRVLSLLQERWTLAEEPIWQLLQSWGLVRPRAKDTRFGGARLLVDSGIVRYGGQDIDASKLRFVYGEGDDFVGIWDRLNPGEPVRRFPKDQIIEAQNTWLRLVRGSQP